MQESQIWKVSAEQSCHEEKQGREKRMPKLCIVIPCYNEEKVLPLTAGMFLDKLKSLIEKGKISDESRILFVDDGSTDHTWDIICSLKDYHMEGISQSRNRGHQSALLAGLMEVKDCCDVTISIDCDGQDDMDAMDEMLAAYQDGCEVVYGVRKSRRTDTFFKRFTAQGYYKLLLWMGVDIVYNHADYRLISSVVLQKLAEYKEVNLFLRGLIPLIGYKSTSVYYERKERLAGSSKYPIRKMLALAFDGITSLSIKPIRLITGFGLAVALISFLGVVWSVLRHFQGETAQGWASMTSIICFIGGIQLVSLGILGEYIGKIYMEVKGRPRYIISRRTGNRAENTMNGEDVHKDEPQN